MSRKKNGSTSLATVEAATPARQITRAQANELVKARALELYHEARTHREEQILAFESEYGRVDRIDHTILADLQRIQARLAAISARQQRTNVTSSEPKVSKHVEILGQLVGSISAYLATERALELFAPVQQSDYVGWNGGSVGPKGQDESVLGGYEIVDDPLGTKNVTPTADEHGGVSSLAMPAPKAPFVRVKTCPGCLRVFQTTNPQKQTCSVRCRSRLSRSASRRAADAGKSNEAFKVNT